MKYKLVIFDWDGTLMDSAEKIGTAMQNAAINAKLAPLSFEQATSIIGLSLTEAGLKLYPDASEDDISRLAENYRIEFRKQTQSPTPMFDGAMDLLHLLKQREHILAVATGKSRRGLTEMLGQIGATELFATTRTSTDAPSKPAPDMILQILEELNIDASDAVMIGDSEYDMAMAQAAGVDRIGVSFGVHKVAVLEQFSPVKVVDHLSEIADLV